MQLQIEFLYGVFLGAALAAIAVWIRRGRTATEAAPPVAIEAFREKLAEFENTVRTTYETEARERFHLSKEIESLQFETRLLSQSLRGDSKAQGDWGEVLLAKILESSGLREGEEFELQTSLVAADDDGARAVLRPDAIIKLPGGRSLVIDAKVSLTAWDRYCREDDETERARHLTDVVLSLRRHIHSLAQKSYQSKVEGSSPDFVFLFTRIEAAWIEALRAAPELLDEAARKGVVLASPTTLFAALKTVASLWQRERQNLNSLAIAEEAGRLYDKFVLFQGDLLEIERALGGAMARAQEAKRKLSEGPGNLVGRAEKLRAYGASTTKQLDV